MSINESSIIISGYGGQGVLFIGMALAGCAMKEDKYVTWLPSYGAEMRGGTANCTVVIADDEVASPFQQKPNFVIALNCQSVEKFEPRITPGGTIVINSSLYKGKENRSDINYVYIPANEIADELGQTKCANVVMLSAFIAKTKLAKIDSLKQIIKEKFAAKAALLKLNELAIDKGSQHINSPVCN